MKLKTKKYLYDIKISIDSISDYLNGQLDFKEYEKNKQLRRAVEREIEIIGESVNRILKTDETIVLENARRIVDTRNWVIHSYDSVDNAVIWGIVINHLPKLKIEVEYYLNQ